MHNSYFLVSSGNEAASSTLSSKTKTIAEIRASGLGKGLKQGFGFGRIDGCLKRGFGFRQSRREF
ncbi:hypothetical protein Scep_029552 [Stephania cephalantha]|uniref:Uncharacterized protein n=1 Tax=Stephania cephalantha TaxID=152367 RepID=A0AAP0DXY1_9MAGN